MNNFESDFSLEAVFFIRFPANWGDVKVYAARACLLVLLVLTATIMLRIIITPLYLARSGP